MRKITPLTILFGIVIAVSSPSLHERYAAHQPRLTYLNTAAEPAAAINLDSIPLVAEHEKRRMVIDPRLARAATIAQERANAHSKSLCWRYVKNALLAAGVVKSRPETAFAKEAGDELVREHGFTKVAITNPYDAPVGAVLVYTAKGGPGHVEIRTEDGFVSDFRTPTPSRRPLLGVYVKS